MSEHTVLLDTFTIACFAATSFVIAFVVAQRRSSRTPPEMDEALRALRSIDDLNRNVEALKSELAIPDHALSPDVVRDLDETQRALDEVVGDLRRALEKTV